jgi:hypothetical protein
MSALIPSAMVLQPDRFQDVLGGGMPSVAHPAIPGIRVMDAAPLPDKLGPFHGPGIHVQLRLWQAYLVLRGDGGSP